MKIYLDMHTVCYIGICVFVGEHINICIYMIIYTYIYIRLPVSVYVLCTYDGNVCKNNCQGTIQKRPTSCLFLNIQK